MSKYLFVSGATPIAHCAGIEWLALMVWMLKDLWLDSWELGGVRVQRPIAGSM